MSLHSTVADMSKMMDEMGLTEFTIQQSFLFGVWKNEIHLSKQQPMLAAATAFAAPAPAAPLAKQEPASAKAAADKPAAATGTVLRSPMVGIAYLSPEPGARPFTQIGARVKAGETLCLIEAMKTFNPVKAESAGVVKEILIQDGQAVEYDTPLVVIE
ncbi:MAG: acetyl-CoA carboxylase biotin carboxyl carrier protein [Proteobacteria bacterium]|nr:acetyl-CoA carboxylase biotin carboxyl carrier protein [Pseudomonadota bacterium]